MDALGFRPIRSKGKKKHLLYTDGDILFRTKKLNELSILLIMKRSIPIEGLLGEIRKTIGFRLLDISNIRILQYNKHF